VTEHVESIIR